MSWEVGVFFSSLAILVLLIAITLVSQFKLGDERKSFIKMKAQSYTFMVTIGVLLVEFFESVYMNVWTKNPYEGMNPFTFLVAISTTYLISLFISNKKYGG
ncbi:hypothetical protein [Salimicrobium flavidum]|uniref:Uncharacterized protein n=1 Tax=Salimicrobium flavidum TaxID=570947 RepID=A0A1N7KPD0_9BACI|nr:hypothetical protein [Salimicrobium flavidum]SIS63428.1 hypothetical protein SAMN05421687_11517 [Salimicrobium flavidum]